MDACCIINGANESVVAENVVNRWIQNRMDILTDSAVFIFMVNFFRQPFLIIKRTIIQLVAILLADKGAITAGVLAMVLIFSSTSLQQFTFKFSRSSVADFR